MLNSKQKKVAFELSGNTIVSASPGTGKTKTLVSRAQYKLNSIPKHQSLALITYTNAAADEISSRLVSDEKTVFIGTIHRFCLEFILRPFGWIYKWNRPKIISYDELKEFIALNKEIDLGDNPLDELNKIKRLLNGDLDKTVEWENNDSLENISKLYYSFLQKRGKIDFHEILFRSYKIVSENNFVLRSLANKFYEISVDEFQDTNIYQYEILKLINKISCCTFFLVGDEKQKIYRFAGAIDNAFLKASIDFSTTIENLDITYRSTSNIINSYSSLYDNHPTLHNESKYKNNYYQIVFQQTDNDTNNIFIEKSIDNLLNNKINISDIAILTNRWQDAFLISRHLRQKFQVIGLGALPHRYLNSSTFSLIRSISNFLFRPSIRNIRVIRRHINIHALENNLLLSDNEITLAINSIISQIQLLDKSILLIDGLNLLKNIFNIAFRIEHSSFDEIMSSIRKDEVNNWSLMKYFKTISSITGITVNTIHQAKGLEYEVVFLSGINEGNIPYQYWDKVKKIRYPLSESNLVDGRAKLYVGISRAKAFLFILHGWRPSLFIPILKSVNK
jgi:DNA helicase II / ATP-dependent DNA helicase PcrA